MALSRHSGRSCSDANEIRQGWDFIGIGNTVIEVVPEGNAQLPACFLQAGERVATASAVVGARASADLAFLDVFADIGFAEIVV